MWDFTVEIVTGGVAAAFEWFAAILNSAPGAWDTLFTIFVILALSRFLLGPLLGVSFSGRSDQASIKAAAKQQRISAAAKQYNKDH